MMKAIRAALDPSDEQDHMRIVCFMTDGDVGNDMEIIGEVQKHPNARVFAFGIGTAVNRFLLDHGEPGRGEVEYVGPNDDGSAAARRFHERVRSPLLTDVSIDWGGLPVTDVYPKRIPDLFSANRSSSKDATRARRTAPSACAARSRAANSRARSTSPSRGRAAHDSSPRFGPAAGSTTSCRRIGRPGAGPMRTDLREAITQLGLDYRLMTQFTSFVAVEERRSPKADSRAASKCPWKCPTG